MLSEQRLELPPTKSESLKQCFTSLIDSMRFYSRIRQLEEEVGTLGVEQKKKLDALDALAVNISLTIQGVKGSIGEEYALELAKQIPSYSKTAIDLTKESINESYRKLYKEKEAARESEKTKFVASLSSFLSTSPFRVLESTITLDLSEGAYSARSSKQCIQNIQYDFSLDPKKSPLFGGEELKLSATGKEIKLPISLGKGLLNKDLHPEYANLHQFVLTHLELCEGHLIAEFSHPERQARVRVVYSRRKKEENKEQGAGEEVVADSTNAAQTSSILTINYTDIERKVNVTSEPSLNKYFESDFLVRALDKIWHSAAELENSKLLLTALFFDGRDVLGQMEGCPEFFNLSWKVISPAVATALLEAKAKSYAVSADRLTEDYVRGKIAMIEVDVAKAILGILGLREKEQG